MSDEFGMSVDDFHCEPKQTVLSRGHYAAPLPRANLIIVRDHLQNAMRAGLNSEALRCVVAAIKEIER